MMVPLEGRLHESTKIRSKSICFSLPLERPYKCQTCQIMFVGRQILHSSAFMNHSGWQNQSFLFFSASEGVYPQTDISLAIVDIDASTGFVDLWVHLSFAIFAIFDLKRHLKLLEMAFDQVQTCLIFPFRWAHFPIKNSRKTQWVHPFSMNFNGLRSVCLYFGLKVHFR